MLRAHLRVAVALLALAGGLALLAPGRAPAATATPGRVVRARLDSIIQPVAEQYVLEAIAAAERQGASAFILELATPGGLLESTRHIFTAMLGAKIPVVVYVAPSGAQAASAGFFLLMASDVAAMAPGTNTGAAHPVGGAGETIEGVMGQKAEEDAAATIRSLAARVHRNVALAESAVVKSRSFTADEALKEKLIEIVAVDLGDLLRQLDGREVAKGKGETVVLRTAGAAVSEVEMSALQRFWSTLAHPNLAYILLTLGFLGLYFELAHPGAVLPGVVGGICILLAFFGLSLLPVNYAGVALILLGLLLFVAEIKVASYGLLTVGGIIALVLGSLMLFRSPEPALRVSLGLIFSLALFTLAVVVFLLRLALRAQRRPVATGVEGLMGMRAVAVSAIAPRGKVFVHGEYWNAEAAAPVAEGSAVEIVAVDGMTLKVRSAETRS